MRIATWNVNSLKARLEKVLWWLERAKPDVLLMQETKLADADAPRRGVPRCRLRARAPRRRPLERRRDREPLRHRGRGHELRRAAAPARRPPDVGDDEPLAEARMIAATCGDVRVVSIYAPNGRSLDSPFYQAKLAWYERLARWLARGRGSRAAARARRRLQRGADGRRRLGPAACHGGTHVSEPERDGVHAALRVGTDRRLPPAPPGAGPLHVVGLSRRQLPQELRDAHRSPARHRAARVAHRRGPRSIARRARASRCRRITRRS